MEINGTPSADEPQTLPACRVAIIGAQRQRVAKVTALIHADSSLGSVATTSLLSSSQSTAPVEENSVTIDPQQLIKGVPTSVVAIEYLPCVATFDSYEDENGTMVRYLVKLEYHGPNGTLIKGKSLAPFFDNDHDDGSSSDDYSLFPGIAAVAIGCGIDTTQDVDKIQRFLETISSSCAAQRKDGNDNDMVIECIQPNPEYASMKEENEAFRDLDEAGKKDAVLNGTIGPGKMANFVHKVAQDALRQKWSKELDEHERSLIADETAAEVAQSDQHPDAIIEETQSTPAPPHIPNPDKIRYACRKCRTILFGVEDLEDPPHTSSVHDFRKPGTKFAVGNGGACQNHFIATPLSWMDNECAEMEGKLHCPKCNTKVGHYSWTGAQCSCGTWVTPAIVVPKSRVDEMKPVSQNIIKAIGALYVNRSGSVGASPTAQSLALLAKYGTGTVNRS